MNSVFFKKNYTILFIIILTVALRWPFITGSFWLDEAAQALQSARPFSQQLNIAYDFQPPLLHLITHFMMSVSDSEWWLRMTSVISGVITVIFAYLIAQKISSPKLAIAMTALLATHSLHIFFSQELRPYSLACMFAVVSWYFLFKIVNREKNQSQRLSLFFYVISSIGGLYSTYLYPFLLISQGFFIFFCNKKFLTTFFIPWMAIVLSFIPWLPYFFGQLAVSNTLRGNTQGWDQVVSFDQLKSIPLVFGKFIFGVISLDVSMGFVISGIALVAAFILLLKSIAIKSILRKPEFQLLLVWLVIPLAIAWLVSFVVPLIQPKRVLFLLPAWLLCLGYVLHQAKLSKRLKVGIVGIFFIINLFGFIQYWINPRLQREDWRDLIDTINHQFSAVNTVAVFGFDEPFAPWLWYQSEEFPFVTTGTNTVYNRSEIDEVMKITLNYEYVLVFDYLRDLTDPNRTIEQWLTEYGYQGVGVFNYPNIGFVRIYQKSRHPTMARMK